MGSYQTLENLKMEKKTGEWKEYHENEQLKEIGKYENGEPTGELKEYHENGKLYKIGKWENSEKTGEWKYYHENGQLAEIGKWGKFEKKLVNGKDITQMGS